MIIANRRDLTGAGDGFMLVNKDGNRFIDESKSGLEMAHTIPVSYTHLDVYKRQEYR